MPIVNPIDRLFANIEHPECDLEAVAVKFIAAVQRGSMENPVEVWLTVVASHPHSTRENLARAALFTQYLCGAL